MPIHYRMYVVEWTGKDGEFNETGIDEQSLVTFLANVQKYGGRIDTVKHLAE